MNILTTPGWEGYELLDSGDGYRLERFGKYVLSRPDPQIIWKKRLPLSIWHQADAYFKKITTDKGMWVKTNKSLPEKWEVKYKNLSFWIKLSPFKHTGVFPEQHMQWDFIEEKIKQRLVILNGEKNLPQREDLSAMPQDDNKVNVLNLFAYTGIASLAAAEAGAKVTHVDASKPTISWAKDNQAASNLLDKPIRWIMDDAMKFVEREIKRGNRYDGIIMDPPVFGHGPTGQMWKFNESFPQLVSLCRQVLSEKPLFIVVNAYAISSSALMLQNVLADYVEELGGKTEVGELVLEESQNKRPLSTGIFGRVSF